MTAPKKYNATHLDIDEREMNEAFERHITEENCRSYGEWLKCYQTYLESTPKRGIYIYIYNPRDQAKDNIHERAWAKLNGRGQSTTE